MTHAPQLPVHSNTAQSVNTGIGSDMEGGYAPPAAAIGRTRTGALHAVSEGIMRGAFPARHMDSVDAANSELGNRVFLQFVDMLQA